MPPHRMRDALRAVAAVAFVAQDVPRAEEARVALPGLHDLLVSLVAHPALATPRRRHDHLPIGHLHRLAALWALAKRAICHLAYDLDAALAETAEVRRWARETCTAQ